MVDSRDEEIAELRSRLARLEGQPAAPPPLFAPRRQPARPRPQEGLWRRVLIAGAVVAGVVVMAKVCDYGAPPATSTDAVPGGGPTDVSAPCDQVAAKAFTRRLLASPLVKGVDVTHDGLIVVVSPGLWDALSLDGERRLVEGFDCAIVGEHSYLTHVHVRASWSAGDLYTASAYDLYDLRRAGYGTGFRRSGGSRSGRGRGS